MLLLLYYRFYRKTKLSGFQDMDCVPCGDPPHAYEPLCSSRVNLVPLSSVVASSRDTVLAVVICIALTSVLLALMLFCTIYCKRQLEKKPHEPCQGGSCHDAKFPSFENIQDHQLYQITSNCYHGTGITCGQVKLFPYQFSEEPCSMENSNGMATYPAWDSQRRPLENTLPSKLNHDLYQTDVEVSDEKTWTHTVLN
uniref:Uncharacterized protein n=2 Tax=Oncorhynchus kisutch TaxID=8019 RepID=A0A8C7DD44_ONCKI